ncbi:MAG: EAL domain-containing protein [Eubacteriales bacterium]|nr:EAL domain-containing protein [Eubacteriales bacterium]
MEYSYFLYVLFIATGGAVIACVLYAFQGNYKPAINKLFFGLGVSVLLWCIGLAVQSSGANASIRFIGGRVAPVGYGTLFGFLLHYVLLLTKRDELLKRWWVYPLIYLPGLVAVYGIAVRPIISGLRDQMLQTDLGWVYISSNPWFTYFYCYYGAFFAVIMLLLNGWRKHAATEKRRRQARLLIHSLWLSVVLGSVTDVGLVLMNIRVPGMASIFAMLPIAAISYSIKQYGFMQPENINLNETILDLPDRTRVYRTTGYCFFGGGLMNLLSQHLLYREADIPYTVLFSGVLLLIGAGILLLNRVKLDELFKELVFAIFFSVLIPLITLRFAVYGGITVWTFFFLPLMISLLFDKRILMGSVIVASALTQLILWCISPAVPVNLDAADYMVRLGLIALTAALALRISRIYQRRLKTNARHNLQQRTVSEITQRLVAVDARNFDKKMAATLAQCAGVVQCERAYLALFAKDDETVSYFHEWLQDGTPPIRAAAEAGMPRFHRAMRELSAGRPMLTASDARALPAHAGAMKDRLEELGVRRFVFLPIRKNDGDIGCMCFASCRAWETWEQDSPAFLPIIANTVADTVVRLHGRRKTEWAAYHDTLTGLPNRLLFKDKLAEAIAGAARANTSIGVAFIDLDTFKSINDTMGHDAGDRLLTVVAEVISGHIGPQDTLARFGGDEFTLLLNQAPGEGGVSRVVRNVLGAIQMPIVLRGQEFFVTGSIGVAMYPQDGTDAETLMKNADIAMYEAKRLGKNQYAFCSRPLKNRAMGNAKLSNLLYRALEKEQMTLYYQPQVGMDTGEIVGMEALLRWKLPDQGLISPAVFIPLAEQTGLIQSIGAWVLDTACRQNKRWQEMGFPAVRMAVNISVQQLQNRSFVQQVADTLCKTGLAPEYLELEITEGVANCGADNIVEQMTQLKTLGISISIDDFGTEYSSLERLKLLPIDRIKMDMQFVRGIENSDKDRAIAQIIINLAKNLNVRVIAEGVETEAQAEFLGQRMCDEIQGYYYYRPMPAGDVERLLRDASLLSRGAAMPHDDGIPADGAGTT